MQAINHNNLTIRVVDAGVKKNDCSSLPSFSFTYGNLDDSMSPYTSFQYKKTGPKWDADYKRHSLSQKIIFINCANPVHSPLYVETGTGLNGGKSSNASLSTHSYVNIGGMKASDLMELCSLERMTLLPAKDYKNMSFKEIHSQLAYGFELSWHNSRCGSCAGICYIYDSNQTRCAGGQFSLTNSSLSVFNFSWHNCTFNWHHITAAYCSTVDLTVNSIKHHRRLCSNLIDRKSVV